MCKTENRNHLSSLVPLESIKDLQWKYAIIHFILLKPLKENYHTLSVIKSKHPTLYMIS